MESIAGRFLVTVVELRSRAAAAGLLCCCSWVLAPPSAAAPDDASVPVLKTKLAAVSLFKNGLGFVARDAALPKGQGPWLIEDLPAPAHGTFWVYASNREATVQNLVAFEKESTESVEAISVPELIEANVGQTVDLRLGEKETIRGKILRVAPGRVTQAPSAGVPPAEPATLVVLQTGTGTTAVNRNAVQQISSESGSLQMTFDRKKRAAALRVTAANPDGKGRIVVQYLAKGITWAPSCAIDISDSQKARLTAKAEVIDEIEDLDDVQVSFVTGFPNLQFADVIDPLALHGDLAAFLNDLANPAAAAQYRGIGGVAVQQAVTSNAVGNEPGSFPTYPTASQESQTREELFFYEQHGVTLKRGERGYYPLFTAEVPYEHVYEWKIGDTLDEQDRYGNRDQREPEADEIWHSIRLTNAGSVPWTTAPAMTMQEGQILGQDLIHYTSVGAKTTVRITKAVDIKAEHAESEVDRKRNAAVFYGSSYDLVDVRGTLKATNYKDKRLTMTISKELSGEMVQSTPEARVERTAKGLKKVNPKSILTWELPVDPRGRVEIEYSYRVYVRD